jgi:sugar/nucleoside kinase (ribokinase family)
MQTLTAPVLYIAGNYNIDLLWGPCALACPGTEVMLEHSALRPGGSAGNCALAAAAMQIPTAPSAARETTPLAPGWRPVSRRRERWPQYPCETSLTVAVTHPNKERSFLSNYGHITRLSAEDILASSRPGDARRYRAALRHLLAPRCCRTIRVCSRRSASAGFQVAVDTGWPPHSWERRAASGEVDRWLGDCDWLLLNEVETLQLAGHPTLAAAAAAWRRVSAAGAAACKRGADGAVLDDRRHHHAP